MNTIETIRAEIERLIRINQTKNGFPAGTFCAIRIEAYEHLLAFLDTLPEQPVEWEDEYREEDLRTRFAFYTYKNEEDDSVLYLSNVFVEEASRNAGFGTKILEAAERVAETIGAITIRLKVKQDSPANAWYRKRGYGYIAFEGDYDWLEKNLEYLKPKRNEQPVEGLEEAAEKHIEDIWGGVGHPGWDWGTRDVFHAFIAGAEWQYKKDQQLIELAEDHAMLAGMNKMKEEMMGKAVGGRYMKADGKVYVESWPLDIDPDSVKAGDEVKLIVIPEEK